MPAILIGAPSSVVSPYTSLDERTSGKQRAGYVEHLEQLVIPIAAQVVEHRARRVRHVDDVSGTIGELPHEPGIDRAESQLAAVRPLARTWDVVEEPAHFATGKIGIDDEPRVLLDQLGVPGRLEAIAELRRAAILPDDRVVDRLARLAIPNHGRLALIRNSYPRDVRRRQPRLRQRRLRRLELRLPDLIRIVLDPAGLWENLLELLLRNRPYRAVVVEDDGAGTRGALVEGEDGVHRGIRTLSRERRCDECSPPGSHLCIGLWSYTAWGHGELASEFRASLRSFRVDSRSVTAPPACSDSGPACRTKVR
nr:hypothetical protein [Chthoniobacter flavus]